MESVKKTPILRYDRGNVQCAEDQIVLEYPFTIFLNEEELVTMLCSPAALDYLAIGFLLSEGFIKSRGDILKIEIDEEKGTAYVETAQKGSLAKQLAGKRVLTTGCGKGTLFYEGVDALKCKKNESRLILKATDILALMQIFNKRSELFIETGGVHSAALCNEKELLLFHEDVGRHNALDKLFGEAAEKEIGLTDKIVLTSGRISSEMLLKAAKRGVCVIVSRSAPTHLALQLATALNITVLGFVRGFRMNIYTETQRIDTAN